MLKNLQEALQIAKGEAAAALTGKEDAIRQNEEAIRQGQEVKEKALEESQMLRAKLADAAQEAWRCEEEAAREKADAEERRRGVDERAVADAEEQVEELRAMVRELESEVESLGVHNAVARDAITRFETALAGSPSHPLTLSHIHTLTFSHSHTFTLSHPLTLTLSQPPPPRWPRPRSTRPRAWGDSLLSCRSHPPPPLPAPSLPLTVPPTLSLIPAWPTGEGGREGAPVFHRAATHDAFQADLPAVFAHVVSQIYLRAACGGRKLLHEVTLI